GRQRAAHLPRAEHHAGRARRGHGRRGAGAAGARGGGGAMTRHFLTLEDLGRDGLLALLDRSAELKRLRGTRAHPRPLAGKSVGILLEKSSTRTRISFEVGVYELESLPITLKPTDIQLGRGESIEDSARMFSRFMH